jgi:hypothetical protein
MRPLSLVPTRTPARPGAAAIEKAVTLCELQSTSEPPSAAMRKTALRAPCNSLRLRAGVCACVPKVTLCAEPPSSVVTVPVTVPPAVEALTVCVETLVVPVEGRGPVAASPSASA